MVRLVNEAVMQRHFQADYSMLQFRRLYMIKHSMLYPRITETRHMIDMDGMWKFSFDPDAEGEAEEWKNGIPKAVPMPVPSSFQDLFTDKDSREYCGDFWYETEVTVPNEWEGKGIFLRIGGAAHRAFVYVNGKESAFHEGGFMPFLAEITGTGNLGKANKIVIKVNNELTETNLPVGKTVTLANGKKMAKPYFDFFNYAGLQRPVKLLALPKEYIIDYSVNFRLEGDTAWVDYTVETMGSHPVTVRLYDEKGEEVSSSEGKKSTLKVERAHLWQVRNAYLYRIVIEIRDEDKLIDCYQDDIGIRTVEIKGTEVLINGSPVYLKGFGKHEDSPVAGRGYNLPMIKRDFECMKWIGANSFRTAHYPYSEEIYQMADREGFLVIDEVAAVGMFESQMNFFEANTGKKTGFFEKSTTSRLLRTHLSAIEEMIARDKNHPCVIAWSLLNEPETTSEAAVAYFEDVFKRAYELDVQKRPRTFAMLMNSLPDTCKCYQFADMIALNRYYGWYLKGGYEICEAKEAFCREMDAWKAKELNKPFIFTEYGADALPLPDKLPSVMWGQEYQIEYLEMNHSVFDSYEFVKGEQVWNFADFQTGEGIMRADGNKKGIFTRERQPKAAAYYLKKRWESLPLDYKK